ncbi:MAG: bifunctional folylpolyglutamate synthase/dihydrofolate synthase [Nitrospirota bacterium]
MSYSSAVSYLYGLQKYGIKLGLEKTETILDHLGTPHRQFHSIHVAGTNGKGSTAAMIASMLRAHGFTVGLFTSPHLVSFTERIMINNKRIAESEVVQLTEEIRERIAPLTTHMPEPTFFEFVTAMAFLYFARNKVDWAVLEVGMGGRLDATNVIFPEVSVISKISYDHKEFLGSTLAAIAREKAGIIKKGTPVISAVQEDEAEEILRKTAQERSAPLFVYGKDFHGILKTSDLAGVRFDFSDGPQKIGDLQTSLIGDHQLMNACLAVKAVTTALTRASGLPGFRASALRKGLAATRWQGRLEWVSDTPPIMVDGAHNPDAAAALSRFIMSAFADKKIILVAGIMADKDIGGILTHLLPLASEIIFTAPNYGRAAAPQHLADCAASLGFKNVHVARTVREAIEKAIKYSNESENKEESLNASLILITGSFYTIGEAKEALGEEAVLGTLRETL